MDAKAKSTVQKIPLLKIKAGPRDGDVWLSRLAEEYNALITFVEINKEADADWFKLDSDATGLKWSGKCWYVHEMLKYEFALEFEIPATYPSVAPEIKLPQLEGKTPKMYRGGIICTTDHFKPLWSKNSPHFGIAHALALGLAPWLAVEVPDLVSHGKIVYQEPNH